MSSLPIVAVGAIAVDGAPVIRSLTAVNKAGQFSNVLSGGIDKLNNQLIEADKMAQQFAVDDSIPVHQVTFALEQARLSVELMMQIRSRLVEGYQEIMRMQL